MFFFRGGQRVKKGTYWEPDQGRKVVLAGDGQLPGDRSKGYFKLPASYLLIPAFLLALGLSMAFPYGVGLVIFGLLYVLFRILVILGTLMKESITETTGRVQYHPAFSFFSGIAKKLRRRRRSKKEPGE